MRLRRQCHIEDDDLAPPSAVAAVVVPGLRQVWRVGDVHVAVSRAGRWEQYPADKSIDEAASAVRAAYLHCLLAAAPRRELPPQGPGRQLILPLLRYQTLLANRADLPYGYGVLNGTPVPERFIETIDLDDNAEEVVLASDGYLSPAPCLEQAEADLAASLAADPLRIGTHPSTKGMAPGARSVDDRTYVRLVRADVDAGVR
ncbi:hypothetical protein [Streptomyces dysideae]|uniref:Uncharacterized protein n=1 Tax=Streptomyces dysideae TaxID=909626 RepID=A0A124IDC9_9ACTN|nr:hypothetical protein [Streptomyces dysideae]KUO14762.1 hypothetical protein AQJ91_44950 [Streptomyces dysideae]